MFTQTRRLFGIASSRTDPSDSGYPLIQEPGAPSANVWQEDLDSLFVMVDAQMIERRGLAAGLPPPSATAPPPAATLDPAPQDQWIGFGMADTSEASPDLALSLEAALAQALAAGLPEPLKADLDALVRVAVRDAVAAALQDQGRAIVRDEVAAVVRAIPAAPAPPVPDPAPAPSTVISIRIRRSRASARSRQYARPSRRAAGPLGLFSR